ncbi:MAG: hypothetical protein Q9216_003553 [Gyalolechia sp. 2 TL-2023]
MFAAQYCRDIPPGHCCKPRVTPHFPNPAYPLKRITFTGLEPLHIAAAWIPHNGRGACEGKVTASASGGGTWVYDVPADQPDIALTAGSYLKMPAGVPERDDIPWMQGEGVGGFVTNHGDWMSGGVDPNRARQMASSLGFGSMAGKGFPWDPKVKMKRMGKRVVDLAKMGMRGPGGGLGKREVISDTGMISQDTGWVLCLGPKKARFVDTIEMEGVLYEAETPGSAVYMSGDGEVLNYTTPAG